MARNILLIQLRQLGDILLTTPCFREIKRAWPEARITFLSHPMGRLIADENPYLHQHLTYDPKGGWRQELKLIRELRAAQYDLVLDFMYNPRSALYARATGCPRRLAFPSRRALLFTEIVPQGGRIEYIVQEKFRYLQHLGIQPVSVRLDLPWSEKHTGPLMQLLQEAPDFSQAPWRIAISPTHRRVERQWPVERYAKIADRLHLEWGASVLWLWGPGEEDFVRHAMSFCEQPMRLAPKTSFRELAALIANCDLFIGNSNGPSHVAVAADTPSLQLHGPTYAATWCPQTDEHQAVQAGAGTPAGRGPIATVTEAEVWQSLEKLQPLLRKTAESRQQNGVRMRWSPLLFS
ncbi:glycosyltransferase family 9 protein [Oligoflexus tunisiensis]|uniref:glycosyltransferase family 9 protein n=1 Tax=Oligoflexus tunisiensis TaxID=708132 RepID=UPI00114CE947|nr:glycosyltransferase family 9 protein [Oligoflexus tunisiensis]